MLEEHLDFLLFFFALCDLVTSLKLSGRQGWRICLFLSAIDKKEPVQKKYQAANVNAQTIVGLFSVIAHYAFGPRAYEPLVSLIDSQPGDDNWSKSLGTG